MLDLMGLGMQGVGRVRSSADLLHGDACDAISCRNDTCCSHRLSGELFELLVSIGVGMVFQNDEQLAVLRQYAHWQALVSAECCALGMAFTFCTVSQVAGEADNFPRNRLRLLPVLLSEETRNCCHHAQ